MKLTDGEKIIISLLADIHKEMKIKGQTDVEKLMTSIYDGHLWSLKWDWTGLLHGYEASDKIVKQTTDILDMWCSLETSYAALSDDDQLTVRTVNGGNPPVFRGFDGNNEDHYGVARHLIDTMKRFQTFAGRDINSHSPSIERSLRMHRAYDIIMKRTDMVPLEKLTMENFINILEAAHPKPQTT